MNFNMNNYNINLDIYKNNIKLELYNLYVNEVPGYLFIYINNL